MLIYTKNNNKNLVTLEYQTTLGKRVSENYRNLSEFWRQIAEQLFCDRFIGILGANRSQFTAFAAIHTKSKIFIGLELLISFRNTVTASMKNIYQLWMMVRMMMSLFGHFLSNDTLSYVN